MNTVGRDELNGPKMKGTIPLEAHVEQASTARLIELLRRVTTWPVLHMGEPQEFLRPQKAAQLKARLESGDNDAVYEAREFLLSVVRLPQAQNFDEE